MSKEIRINRFAAIDGLRGIAILWVLMLHYWLYARNFSAMSVWRLDFTNLFAFGAIGVSLFFALSGFCLYYPFARRSEYQPNWRTFFERRAIRIIPGYIAALLICTPLWLHSRHWWVNPKAQAHPVLAVLSHLAFIHPFFKNLIYSVDVPLWSLSPEIHFYLALPMLAFLFFRRPMATFIGACILSFALQFLAIRGWLHFPLFHIFPARLAEFASGMYAAHYVSQHKSVKLTQSVMGWTLALVPLVLLTHLYTRLTGGRMGWHPICILLVPSWCALIVMCLLRPNAIVSKILCFRPLTWIGEISYSIYLFHMVVFEIPLQRIVPASSPEYALCLVVLVLALGWAGFMLVEKPFMKLRDRLRETPTPQLSPSLPGSDLARDASP